MLSKKMIIAFGIILASSAFYAEANAAAVKYTMDEKKKKDALVVENSSSALSPIPVTNDAFTKVDAFVKRGPYIRICLPDDPRGRVVVDKDLGCGVLVQKKKEGYSLLPSHYFSLLPIQDLSPQEYLDHIYGEGWTIYTGVSIHNEPRTSLDQRDAHITLVIFYKTTKPYSEWEARERDTSEHAQK